MIKKQRKEKSKIISKAQKTLNKNNYSSRIINGTKVIVQIPKEEAEDGLTSVLTVGIMFALQKIGIKDIDVTIRETKSNFEIIVEK
jgi:hypothetical protein